MTEITRAQFAVAAVLVALAAWLGSRALSPTVPGGAVGGTGAVVADAVAGGERGTGAGEVGGTDGTSAEVVGGGGAAAAGADGAGEDAAGAPGRAAGGGGDAGAVLEREPAAAVVVHVAGAVRRPGIYRLKAGERIADALARAGGGAMRADLDAINLAAPVKDGAQILVPRRGAPVGAAPGGTGAGGSAGGAGAATGSGGGGGSGAGAGPGAAAVGGIIDLNTATAEQLETLDGVGPATSAKILQYRTENGPFRSVDDLEQIPGIGPKKLAAMRPRVRV
ncbi:hypothetical protein DSM112329_03247 [Paraconexibacter sp. AEG42_29]|uniref:Helix-hairpin-helix DNA-binding motif class 1 domain-containing protein n=1 Tax=Paraconexibacter sp. AEG42_29 TaxID=2997339 RepID=A0AAU7AXL6_9ACTN